MARKFRFPVLPKLPKPLKLFVRFLPLLLAIEILGTFITTRPEEARELWNRALERFGQRTAQETPSPDPVAYINALRTAEGLPPLSVNPRLDQASRLLGVSFADDPESALTAKEAAGAVGYRYQLISYFSLEYGQPVITPPEENFAREENRDEVLQAQYTEIGSSLVAVPGPEGNMVMTVIIAQPVVEVLTKSAPTPVKYYSGVELWAEIQMYRREQGVSEFRQDNLLCTLASIRVNQLITLGTLDDHKGFEPLVEEYRDKGLEFGNLGENILMGYQTPQEAVAAWDSSLGHRALMRDGSYVWGCAAANYGFAVLIAAY